MTSQLQDRVSAEKGSYESLRLSLEDGAQTTLHVAKFSRDSLQPKIVRFERETKLAEWCREKSVANALVGGFFDRASGLPLGDMWLDGVKQDSNAIPDPWAARRGSIYVDKLGNPTIGPRYDFEDQPKGSLLQAGPILLKNGHQTVYEGEDTEGFSETSDQFDSDITQGRYPRAAIGMDDTYFYAVACDGRVEGEAGLSFDEFAQALGQVGVSDALNLDGGSSSTVVYDSEMRNNSWGGGDYEGVNFTDGRPIYSAIVFEPQA